MYAGGVLAVLIAGATPGVRESGVARVGVVVVLGVRRTPDGTGVVTGRGARWVTIVGGLVFVILSRSTVISRPFCQTNPVGTVSPLRLR